MLAIFAAILALAAWRALSGIQLERLLELAESAAPLALGTIAIASALAAQRLIATRRALRSRRAVAVVPADEFDAEPAVVLSFAAQIAGSERSVTAWWRRRASAVRVSLACDRERRLVYLMEVPARATEVLRGALGAFEGVELRSAEEAQGEPPPAASEATTVRTELILAHPSIEPLARPSGDPDPLQPFAAAMAGLDPARGEEASVCVDLLAARGHRAGRLRRRLRREARRRYRERPRWGDLLDGERRRDRARPDELVDRRLTGQALDAKLRDAGSLFEAQVLISTRAPERGRAKLAMQRLLAAFEPLADRNWFRVSGLALPGVAFLGSDLPLRRRAFDRRAATGYFRPARRMILTARELAGFLKPPTANCRAENVLRCGALLAPAPPLETFEARRDDLIPLGKIAGEEGERLVGVRVADTFFSYTAGRSRYGKTENAIVQFVHLARSGQGCLFLDPHGDALDRIAPYLAASELARRIVRIDLRPGRSVDELPGWNLFDLGGGIDAEARVEAIVDAFASALEWGERSTRAINLTTQAAAALAAIGPVLSPAGLAPTIFQIPTLLSDEKWRSAVLPFLPQASRRFWRDRFPLLAAEAITPVTNMIDRLRASTPITALLGQRQTTYRVREAMDERLIVLACPGSGGTRDRLLANLIVFDLFHGARSRAELAPDQRKLFWPFFDEVQSYDGAASGNLAALLEQSAKFGLRAAFLNQNPERLSPATLNALLTNRSHLLASALNSHAAALLTKEWAGQPSPAALTKLDRFRFVAQVTDRGRASAPFALRGIRLEDVFDVDAGRPSASAPRAGAPAAETLAHLETLDARIFDRLREAGVEGGAGGGREPVAGQVRAKRGGA
ncbi:MAG TPA: hypothetical protein VG898_10155 [Solirubrobacterales bacterium]|nr:hypothetical protein [Solirubrobacterales bacterium]